MDVIKVDINSFKATALIHQNACRSALFEGSALLLP